MEDDLELPDNLVAEMAKTFRDPNAGTRWLHTRVPDLGDETPAACLRAGRAEDVVAVLRALNVGLTR